MVRRYIYIDIVAGGSNATHNEGNHFPFVVEESSSDVNKGNDFPFVVEESSDPNKGNDFSCNADEFDEEEYEDDIEKNHNLRSSLRKWAIEHRITHSALKDLLEIINTRFEKDFEILPQDPRTLLQTPQAVNIMALNDGEYWHYGLKNCLQKLFCNLDGAITISIIVNIDGLPLFKSSKMGFWPILFKITEMPQVPALVIGIFSGPSKCEDLNSFLMPFVDELNEIMTNGVFINSHKITLLFRCFLCDSPARAFVKGILTCKNI